MCARGHRNGPARANPVSDAQRAGRVELVYSLNSLWRGITLSLRKGALAQPRECVSGQHLATSGVPISSPRSLCPSFVLLLFLFVFLVFRFPSTREVKFKTNFVLALQS